MNRLISLAIISLGLSACGPCPNQCTAEAVAECENQRAIFSSKLTIAADKNASIVSRLIPGKNGAAAQLATQDREIVRDIITRRQDDWNKAQVQINFLIPQNDLEKICKFMRNDTASLSELQELAQVGKNNQSNVDNIERKIIESTLNEIDKSITGN